ncbi:MAG: XamI family restriction endonuclease [Acidobacteriales bacterium]|nr:XamI family restriction endonuclease [Candidatus Koribacter versatilis]MBI3644945.1 XamI family restriction endonuclease [Terriglobales bacterium]
MPVNRDQPDLWKEDIAKSVDMYNDWFLKFAPKAFRDSRARATKEVKAALHQTANLAELNQDVLRRHPEMLPILRMATCPPIARDRLIGLSKVSPNLVKCMEIGRSLPLRMDGDRLSADLQQMIAIITKMIDPDICVWIERRKKPSAEVVQRAATVIADRLCGAVADPIVRNAQEQRQLAAIAKWLQERGYSQLPPGKAVRFREMKPGSFAFRVNVPVILEGGTQVNIPIDVVAMPPRAKQGTLPILIEAKSAGDFTNVNKRRKEEAIKMSQLRATYGQTIKLNLFLCGYFDSGYLGYEAAERIDWIWEHRIDDLAKLGL